ncbi:MFS general substrate transporter [Aspergillus steynii IBT 23096]|uniref:MFS general substrate transporter n=1 Tax=Aspergillus steynii IBT 23096 TaxID=1392250 RepID=A0A2I2G099_9EURO|nr:MFS general substrate transporter [Aspergillus steynii IBT 23096]PLB46300.1 MFS general substrate transporter [Aspergillus steynii IBT 23096]
MPLERRDRESEDVPFLASDSHLPSMPHRQNDLAEDFDDKSVGDDDQPNAIDPNLRLRLMVTLFTMILAVEVGLVMAGGPVTRIYESIVCRDYYAHYDPTQIASNGQVDEELCKIKDVQSELAAVKGYMEFFDGILSIFMAIPYGLLADRRGRKPTICLSIPGFALNCAIQFAVMWYPDVFPLRTVWISCLSWLFGGGPVVAFAIIWTMMSDVTTEDERAAMFFKFGVASMGADFASNAASSWLMAMDPWLPLFLGWGVTIVGVFCALSLPETMHACPPARDSASVELSRLSDGDLKRSLSKEQERPEPLKDDDDDDASDPLVAPADASAAAPKPPLLTRVRVYLRNYVAPYTFIFRSRQIILLLSTFLVYRLSRGSSWFLIQYISTRYNWTISQANFLIAFKPALTIPLFLIILPAVSRHLLARMPQIQKDLTLARISIICLAVGTLGIGLSPTIATLIPSLLLQTCGSAFVYLARSLITTLVHREETARLFTVIEVLQSVGNVIASLLITGVFQIGLQLGGMWIGLAWIMTSLAFMGVGVSIWLFRLKKDKEEGGEREV